MFVVEVKNSFKWFRWGEGVIKYIEYLWFEGFLFYV